MEEKGYIKINIEGIVGNRPLKPEDIDIADVKEIISDVENFLYPGRTEKTERPLISYKIEGGSVTHSFYLPISSILLFNGLTGEIAARGAIDFLDYKRSEIIAKFQHKAIEKNYIITLDNSLTDAKPLKISNNTKYFSVAADFIETEFILYGKIDTEGGVVPNFHIDTKEYGRLTVSATVDQLMEGEKRLYKLYGIRASGKLNLNDGRPYDLKLLNYIEYNPVFNVQELDILIERATPALSGIVDVDAWLNQLRGGSHA